MTTRTDLLEIIRNGENSGVEFKRDTIQNHDLARELVAFSNFEGGIVILGVEDDGSIPGITKPNIEEWVMTACRDKIRRAIIPFYEIINTLAGVLLSSVPQVVSARRGLVIEGVATLREMGICYRAVLLPLSEGGSTIDHVLGATNYRALRANEARDDADQFPSFTDVH